MSKKKKKSITLGILETYISINLIGEAVEYLTLNQFEE